MFNKIDLASWPRMQTYYYFSQMAPTGYSITVEVDVTKLVAALKERGLKFFPTYLWLMTRNVNKQVEFKCAVKDGAVGYYDELTPLYATWHDDTKTFSLMWTEYSDDYMTFYNRYLENQQKYGDNHGILAQPETPPPETAYTVSAVPWVNFKHFAVHSYENKPYFFPSIEAGKYEERDSRIMMPLSLTCHHATTDGYHIDKLLKDLAADIESLDWL